MKIVNKKYELRLKVEFSLKQLFEEHYHNTPWAKQARILRLFSMEAFSLKPPHSITRRPYIEYHCKIMIFFREINSLNKHFSLTIYFQLNALIFQWKCLYTLTIVTMDTHPNTWRRQSQYIPTYVLFQCLHGFRVFF